MTACTRKGLTGALGVLAVSSWNRFYTLDDYPVISLWLFDDYSLFHRQPASVDEPYCSAEQVEQLCTVGTLVYSRIHLNKTHKLFIINSLCVFIGIIARNNCVQVEQLRSYAYFFFKVITVISGQIPSLPLKPRNPKPRLTYRYLPLR